MFRRLTLTCVVIAALAAGACSDDSAPPPTPESPVPVSETVTGTVTVNGAISHAFTVARAGTVTAQITALAPDDTVILGLLLGTWNGTACQVVIANDMAKLSTTVVGTATTAGSLCVRVYDVGGLTASADYEVRIDHF